MRIVLPMTCWFPDFPGGSGKLAFDESQFLVGRGHEVWAVAQDVIGVGREYEHTRGVNLLRYQRPSIGAFDPRRLTVHQDRTQRLIQRYVPQADVVHGHGLLQYAGALDAYGDQVRSVYSVHSPARMEMSATARGESALTQLRLTATGVACSRIERECIQRSTFVTAESSYTVRELARLYGENVAGRVRVVPGWVDPIRFRPVEDKRAVRERLDWPTDRPILFTLRRLVPRMGIDLVLRAISIARHNCPQFVLIIGGQGPSRVVLEEMAATLGVDDIVRFVGRVADSILPDMYAAATAFVLPTFDLECFGIIAVEALASGCPVLATPVGAIPEVLSPVEPRWLASTASATDVAALLTRFLHNELPSHTAAELRAYAVDKYGIDVVMPQMLEALGI
ncbi:MAG TPA: glycosyltransferase family 4 protein [Candidatus Deferrimicrobium sp.]|nr:glycosyltransferase family 4 protein [Candidatus Deferrimicrobium sp.]